MGRNAAGVDAYALQAAALRHQIAIAPGRVFSARRAFRNCIRISCGYPFSPRMGAAIAKLGELAAAQLGYTNGAVVFVVIHYVLGRLLH
jgi:DNA-binding transcriptional MocR family regulator